MQLCKKSSVAWCEQWTGNLVEAVTKISQVVGVTSEGVREFSGARYTMLVAGEVCEELWTG